MKSENLTPLVIEAQKGNQKALNDLIESCYNDIYYFALKTVKKEDIAADVTQDACLKIIQSLDKLNDPAAFKSWALRITYNFCAMHFRAAKDILVDENEDGETIFDTLADDSEDAQPDKAYENAEFKEMMRDMIESLPAEQASALMLYYYEKVSVKEIAEIHGVSEGTVKSRLNYGRKAVKEKVGDYEKRTGIRLHSITPLPLLLAWFFAQSAEKAPAAVAGAISSSVAGAAGAAGATAAGVSAATATAATAATTAGATAATAAAVAAKAGVSALAAKVIAIVVGAALAVSAAVGGIYIATNNSDTEITEEDSGNENNGVNNGENSGENGENTPPAHTHVYENGVCTVCGEAKLNEGLEFTLNEDGESYSVSGIGSCRDLYIVIPATHEGKPVTYIASEAFKNERRIEGIIIPEGVTSIGESAFENCKSLTSITIPNSVTSIGYEAFENCTSLNYNEYKNGKYLGNSNNPHLILCDVIDKNASSFDIHVNTKFIGCEAFMACTSLTSVTIPDSVTSLCDRAFYGCGLTSISIGNSVTSIGNAAFDRCRFTSITLPNSVTSIGIAAFSDCTSLTSISIPDSVTSIGDGAFNDCSSLTSISIGNSVTSIGEKAFFRCTSLTSITIPESVTSIGSEAFDGCTSLTSITVDKDNPFYHSAGNCLIETESKTLIKGFATSVIPTDGSVTHIGNRAFYGCNLTSISIPESVTSIGEWAFTNCNSLTSITLPDSVTSIGYRAFNDCDSLTSITLPDSVTSIGECAFEDCDSLKSITIPESVTSIGKRAFIDCFSLVSITVDKDNPFYHSAGNCLIETESKTLIKGFTTSVIPTDGSVTHIGYGAFYDCNFTSISIPESVTSIGDLAFAFCFKLTSITIPDNVTSIGEHVFDHCESLTSITIPDGVTTIYGDAFYGCSSLTSITIPESVTSIGQGAFGYCDSLTSINYGGTIEQWNAVDKYVYFTNSWNANTGDYTVHCTDGDIAK